MPGADPAPSAPSHTGRGQRHAQIYTGVSRAGFPAPETAMRCGGPLAACPEPVLPRAENSRIGHAHRICHCGHPFGQLTEIPQICSLGEERLEVGRDVVRPASLRISR